MLENILPMFSSRSFIDNTEIQRIMRWLDIITGFDGHEFEQPPGVDDGQGSLVCYSLWSHKESGMTEQLN